MYFSTDIFKDLIEYASLHKVDTNDLEYEFSGSKEQSYIGYDTVVKTLNHIGRALNDEYLGLHIGERISLKVTEYVNNIMLNSKTAEESILNAIEYSKLISDALECSFEKSEDCYSIIYEENPNWSIRQRYAKKQILDLALLSNVKSLIAYTNYRYYPVCVCFNYEKPKYLNEYYRLFNCRLKFNQPRAEIIYENQILARHSRNVQFGLLENLKEKVADEIKNLPSENELTYRLKKCILNYKPSRIDIGEAAKRLNISKRTLQRKLKKLNTTFKKTESGLQLKLAKTYLEEKQKSTDEISYLLGFSESSAFIRFFRASTAQTPVEYRSQNNF